MPEPSLSDFQPKSLKFDALMQFRVKHVLLVSSPYDSYVLEEDGQLTEAIYNEYLELKLTITPQIKRASNAAEAIEILKRQPADLIIVFKRVSDIDVVGFAKEAKRIRPGTPVVFLAYHERELASVADNSEAGVIDRRFIWTGDVRILLSIIKLVEDAANVDEDTRLMAVRVIIIVEDSVRFYSSYLPLLYTEIMTQTRALMAEGLNVTDKLLRMRARPKILLADNYEDALALFAKYRKFVLGLLSDVAFAHSGQKDYEAGLTLVKEIREQLPDLPVLLQSSDLANARLAHANDVGFIHKKSPTLHNDIRQFVLAHFGFGHFSFCLPDGTEVARAHDFRELESVLAEVDDRSILYHGSRNHFSNWLMARTEFDLAERLRPRKVSEFRDIAALRAYLIKTLRAFRREKQMGLVSDFSRHHFDLQSEFARIGGGSLGGKGRGLAFVNALLSKYKIGDEFEGATISVPQSVVIGTDIFDEFIEENKLLDCATGAYPDREITNRFLSGRFASSTISDMRAILEVFCFPLAVRSSSMLEDSHLEPAAGVYDTHMLVNSHDDIKIRQQQLETAVKLIYASTFFQNARVYHEMAGNRVEEEKMAVIVQQAVGQYHGDHFYPSFSGAGLSYNYYSMDGVLPEDGVVYVALGLGKTIVDGMNCLRFAPSYPEKLPQFATTKDMLRNSQHEFYAIDLRDPSVMPAPGGERGLARLPLTQAESDRSIYAIASTYSAQEERVYDGTSRPGSRIITFAPILKHHRFPLPEITRYLLRLGSQGLNCPVEIEFAVNLYEGDIRDDEFYFLQIRPMVKETVFESVSIEDVEGGRVIGKSENALGNMRNTEITDIVYVDPASFDAGKTVEIAGEVGRINQRLKDEGRPYLLIGPGRWGTSERWLGVPVNWNQISRAKVIVESAYGDFAPDPSFGTHFFQNLTTFQVGYMTVNAAVGNGFLDWDWLDTLPVSNNTAFVRHVTLASPLEILIDGRAGAGLILKP